MSLFKRKGRPHWYYESQGYIKQMSLHTTEESKAKKIAYELDEVVLRMKAGLLSPEEFADKRKKKKVYSINALYQKYYKINIHSIKTKRYYISKLLPFVERYSNMNVVDFTFEEACVYRDHLLKDKTTKTANNHLSEIKRMFEWFKNAKYITENPLQFKGFLPSTKATNPRKAIPLNHIMEAIRQAGNEYDEIYWTIMLHTGLRRNDAGTLTPDDVVRGIFQKKTGEYRQIPMTDKLKSYGDKIYNVMDTNSKQQHSLERFQRIIQNQFGYHTDFHSIRHTTMTLLVNSGEFDETQVGRILGTESSVATYAKTDFNRATKTINKLVGNA